MMRSLRIQNFALLLIAVALLLLPAIGRAQDKALIVPIAGETSADINPATYVAAIYRWGVGIAALLALAELVYGAVQYTASAGNIGTREGAVSRIRGAIFGLVLLLAASVILRTLNSDFGNIRTANVDNSAVVAQHRAYLTTVRDERLAAFTSNGAGLISPDDYLAVKDVLDFYDADGRTPIENAGDLAIVRNVNEELMSQFITRKNAVTAAHGDVATDPVLTSIENELVASLAEERARLTAGDFSEVTSGLNSAEKSYLFRKYGL